MDVRHLTPVEIADLLDAAYRADQGEDVDGPDPLTRGSLAAYLGGDQEMHQDAWLAWRYELITQERRVDEAANWLDVKFLPPCPDDWARKD